MYAVSKQKAHIAASLLRVGTKSRVLRISRCRLVLHLLHCCGLMLFSRMRVAENHVDLAVAKHGRECYKVNARLSGPCGPSMAQRVQGEMSNLAPFHGSSMRCVYLYDRARIFGLHACGDATG